MSGPALADVQVCDAAGIDVELHRSLLAASAFLERAIQKPLAAVGLTPPQFYILAMLDSLPERGVTPRDIEREAEHRTNLTQTFDRMERDGLLERVPNPGDRRSVLIRITAKGARVRDRANEVYRDALPRLLSGLPIESKRICQRDLRALADSLHQALSPDSIDRRARTTGRPVPREETQR